MKVLIAMSDTGGGHRSISNAVAEALHLRFGARVAIVDLFALDPASFAFRFTRLYGPVIRWYPPLYGAAYHLSNHRHLYDRAAGFGGGRLLRRIRESIRGFAPDLIVSAHALCNRLLFDALDGVRSIPVLATVTELVTVHTTWVESEIARYTVATAEAFANTVARGAPPDRVVMTGLPVGRRFGRVSINRSDLRRAYGLDPEKFTVVAVGGGEGAGAIGSMMEHLWRSRLDAQSVVVCGRAERLRARLQASAPAGHRVLGFVRTVPELMHLADVVVTKGGPQTIGETLCAGRPIIVTQSLPGQEEGNEDWIVRHGVGFAAHSPEGLLHYLSGLIGNPGLRQRLRDQARAAARPDAADNVAAVCGDLVGEPRITRPARPLASVRG